MIGFSHSKNEDKEITNVCIGKIYEAYYSVHILDDQRITNQSNTAINTLIKLTKEMSMISKAYHVLV